MPKPVPKALLAHVLCLVCIAPDLQGEGTLRVMGENHSGTLGVGKSYEDYPNDQYAQPHTHEHSPVLAVPEGVVKVTAANDSEYVNLFYLDSEGVLWASGFLPGDDAVNVTISFKEVDSEVVAVSAAGLMAAYVKKDGSLWIWGPWSHYDWSSDAIAPANEVQTKIVDSGVTEVVAVGGDHSWSDGVHVLYIDSNGDLWGFGHNGYGQLGLGKRIGDYPPADGPFEPDPKIIISGVSKAWAFTGVSFFLKQDGSLWGMGRNYNDLFEVGKKWEDYPDEDGDGYPDPYEPTPVEVIPSDVVDVAISGHSGNEAFFYIDTSGVLRGRGDTSSGQLMEVRASGDTISDFVEIDSEVTEVEGGSFGHVLYKKSDGSLWGLGSNAYGQLGLGKTEDDYTDLNGDGRVDYSEMIETVPQKIVESGVTQFAAGTVLSAFVVGEGVTISDEQETQVIQVRIAGSSELSDGWRFSTWFVNYFEAGNNWVFHEGHGWLYLGSSANNGYWMWDVLLGWFWTGFKTWPYVFSHDASAWFYLATDAATGERIVYDTETKLWSSVAEKGFAMFKERIVRAANVADVMSRVESYAGFSAEQKIRILTELFLYGKSSELVRLGINLRF